MFIVDHPPIARIDWDQIFDGQVYGFDPRELGCSREQLRRRAYKAARRRGRSISTQSWGGDLYVWALDVERQGV